jgi:hypothetical protein
MRPNPPRLACLADKSAQPGNHAYTRQAHAVGFGVAHPLKLDDLIFHLLDLFERSRVLGYVLARSA